MQGVEGVSEGWGGIGARVLPCDGVGVFCLAPPHPPSLMGEGRGGAEREGGPFLPYVGEAFGSFIPGDRRMTQSGGREAFSDSLGAGQSF